MRLIDKDDLILTILTNDLCGDDDVDKAILNAPTVDAIPIEWIMWYWRRSQPDGTQEDAWMKLGVLKMLRDWKKENEKQTVE